ncbi:MAG: tryptophan-rich sensory protein [Rhodocyclaceae bacterium]|nr:tryptophan-rich sensory protein [Rhodocyclaceae bacterium]
MMTTRPRSHQYIGLLGFLVAVFVAAALGAVASVSAPTFYAQLTRPEWSPPAWLFGPVWSMLYCMMGVAVWLVWRKLPVDRAALLLFAVQLAVNALWSWLFFAWHQGALAFADVLLLWVLIGATIRAFWRTSRIAAVMLVPYWLWVSFATALTFAVWQGNPALL